MHAAAYYLAALRASGLHKLAAKFGNGLHEEPLTLAAVAKQAVRITGAGRVLSRLTGGDFTAKDFRTWHATVLATVALAASEHALATVSGRKRAVTRAVKEVADYLGDTPAVARGSYIDPRVIERYQHGARIARILGDLGKQSEFGELATQGPVERAVLRLLAGDATGASARN